ncbi:MAG: 5-bromo-4-chloroindolyl phosphate hydrolysis family protein [Clostridia bacterium]|nr:5-bromo-4-chloroindolyl phosphate hydrolysis family protein [Clostridia bacterium]
MIKAKRLLRKLDYLPRWAWYLLSLSVGGPFGPLAVYLIFHALEKAAAEQPDEQEAPLSWDVDIDRDGVHVRSRAAKRSRRSGHTYQDDECTVTDDSDVERQWAKTETSAGRVRPSESPASEPKAAPISSDASVGDVIREGKDALRRIRRANDLIADVELSAQIDSIERSCEQILSILEQRPQLPPQLRTFLRYYLPTTLHLLDARAKLENTASTPKAIEIRTRISEAIAVIDKAFLKQVEALDEYRFIDLESEMDVLRDMLRSDGLLEDDQPQEDDPFASVLENRAAAKRRKGAQDDQLNIPMAGH